MVRLATYEDIPKLIEWSQRMHEKSAYSALEYDQPGSKGLLYQIVRDPSCAAYMTDNAVLIIAEQKILFSKDRVAKELFFFSDDGCSPLEILTLWKSVKSFCVERGLDYIMFSSMPTNEKFTRFLDNQGFAHIETLHLLKGF
jgi:hypothetical protein